MPCCGSRASCRTPASSAATASALLDDTCGVRYRHLRRADRGCAFTVSSTRRRRRPSSRSSSTTARPGSVTEAGSAGIAAAAVAEAPTSADVHDARARGSPEHFGRPRVGERVAPSRPLRARAFLTWPTSSTRPPGTTGGFRGGRSCTAMPGLGFRSRVTRRLPESSGRRPDSQRPCRSRCHGLSQLLLSVR